MTDLSIIRKYEGLKLKAYKCPAGVWTIGFGATFYENGTKVKEGDVITRDRADKLLHYIAQKFLAAIRPIITAKLTANQESALLSFAYNVGTDAFRRSTLLRKVNANPADPTIRQELAKWIKAGGAVLPGLQRRRAEEADLYFKP
jgi:lysozyme